VRPRVRVPPVPGLSVAVAPEAMVVLPLPLMVPPVQLRLPVTVSAPEPARVPPGTLSVVAEPVALTVGGPPETVSVPETLSWWMVSVPLECVTVLPLGMTTSSVLVGTAPVLQLEALDQLPLLGPVQVTVREVV